MIPILFTTDATDFTTNGIGRLTDCISCIVTEERNGIYELEMEYPITGEFYQMLINEGGIIGVIHDDQHDIQPFDVYSYSAPISGIVTFYAHHISYRLNNVLLGPFTATSVAQAMTLIPINSITANPFTFWTDKATAASFELKHPETVRTVLGGTSGSILDVFGTGEYEFDGFAVKLYAHRGTNSGVTIRYGKNMTDITHEKDTSETFNAIAPYWIGEDGTVVYLQSGYVKQSNAPWTVQGGSSMKDSSSGEVIYFSAYPTKVVAMDFSMDFDTQPTEQELQQKAADYLANNQPWLADVNTVVDFVQLWQTEEYADVAALQRVHLCDYVSIYYPELGVIIENQEVIRVVYNVLLERFDEMELGSKKTGLYQSISEAILEQVEQTRVDFGSMLDQAIDHATQLITGGLGGHVVFTLNSDGEPQEILIMDTDDVSTAVNVLRINANGIGFSTTGYSGPYSTAWTIDGHFNASYITTGQMSANMIHGGTLMLGGAADANGVLMIYDANGNVIGKMDKDGAELTGDIHMNSTGAALYIDPDLLCYKHSGNGWYWQRAVSVIQTIYDPNYQSTRYASAEFFLYSTDVNFNTMLGTGVTSYTRAAVQRRDTYDVSGFYEEYDITNEIYHLNRAYYSVPILCSTPTMIGLGTQVTGSGDDYYSRYCGIKITNSAAEMYAQVGTGTSSTGLNQARMILNTNGNVLVTNGKSGSAIDGCGLSITKNTGFELFAGGSQTGNTINYYLDLKMVSASGTYKVLLKVNNSNYTVAYNTSSSERYKDDIEDIKDENIDPKKLLDLPVRQFKFKPEFNPYSDFEGATLPGFIAEEVAEIYPVAVTHRSLTLSAYRHT